jgi:3-dehydroquinate synthase
MVLAARLSVRVAGLPAEEAARLEALVARAGLPVAPPRLPLARWLELMARDKKVEAGVIRFVLLEALGRAVLRHGVPAAEITEALAATAAV